MAQIFEHFLCATHHANITYIISSNSHISQQGRHCDLSFTDKEVKSEKVK